MDHYVNEITLREQKDRVLNGETDGKSPSDVYCFIAVFIDNSFIGYSRVWPSLPWLLRLIG